MDREEGIVDVVALELGGGRHLGGLNGHETTGQQGRGERWKESLIMVR